MSRNGGPRHVLIVSWWYPPLAGGGVYRPLNFSRHLAAHGDRVTVLTGGAGARHRQDASLLERVPASVRILRCPFLDPFVVYGGLKRLLGRSTGGSPGAGPGGARGSAAAGQVPGPGTEASWKDLLSESLALPDRWRTWVWPATLRGVAGLIGRRPDLVFSTSPPHSVHLVARRLAAVFRAPWVQDFRDPWVGNPFREFRARVLVEKDRALERRVVQRAARVITNTPALEQRFRERYPDLEIWQTITNGFDPDQFDTPAQPVSHGPGPLEIVHVGHLYGARSGRYLVQGLEVLRRDLPDLAARVKVRLVGAIDGREGYLEDVRRRGVEDLLDCPGPIPHAEALRLQREAPALLILGVEEEGREVQVPGKLYEYVAARRPILTLSRQGGAIQQVLDLARVPYEIAEPDDPRDIAAALGRFVERHERGDLGGFDDEAIARFRYDRLGDRLLECFDEVLAGPARR
jgi:glycosyltransferase involved in cell wall biosynthesis